MISRRFAFAALACALLASPALAATYTYKPQPGDMTLGKEKAKIVVIEYASVGCPHCAQWDLTVFDAFKKKYIDSGQVRFVYREMITGQPQVAGMGFLTARCAAPAKYFDVVRGVYSRQEEILRTGRLGEIMRGVAHDAGLDDATWEACVTNQDNVDALTKRTDANGELDGVSGTPYFVVNGAPMSEGIELADFDKAIAAAKKRR